MSGITTLYMILEGKEACEQIQGYWIVELGSLQVLARLNLMKLSSLLADKKMYTESLMADAQALSKTMHFIGMTNDNHFQET